MRVHRRLVIALASMGLVAVFASGCASDPDATGTGQSEEVEGALSEGDARSTTSDEGAEGDQPQEAIGDSLSDSEATPDPSTLQNPFAGDEASTEIGAIVFQDNCATCHGETGAGDGPSADGLESAPGDLGSRDVQQLSDGELFYIIAFGQPEGSMPAWEAVLDEEDRWAVVNFLRTLADPSG